MIWNRDFWLATLERVVATAAQAAVGLLGADGLGLVSINWVAVLSATGIAALVSLLKALATNAVTQNGPGIGSAEVVAQPDAVGGPDDIPDEPDDSPDTSLPGDLGLTEPDGGLINPPDETGGLPGNQGR